MSKTPDNYINYNTEGYALWEIWYSRHEGLSYPVVDTEHSGRPPLKFIEYAMARDYAVVLAKHNPEKRFKLIPVNH